MRIMTIKEARNHNSIYLRFYRLHGGGEENRTLLTL